jgi:hypothetical protein
VSTPDGGLPFALPVADPAGCAPFWVQADPAAATLQSTAFAAGVALRVARRDRAVREHPWLAAATEYCFREIRALTETPHAIALSFAVGFVDAAHDFHAEAATLLDRLAPFVPPDGLAPVAGGSEGETLRALDFAPLPDRPARALFKDAVIDAELQRLAGEQHDDGGWRVDFASYSPAAELEWSGYATVRAVSILQRNGVL